MKKLPKKVILVIFLLVLIIGLVGVFLFRRVYSPTRILDKFPVMLINNGKTAVYYQMKIAKSSITNQIIISNLTNEKQEGTKIYEDIPKEIAQSASELDFKPKPIVLEDDPIILWDLGPLDQGKSVELQYTPKKRYEQTLCTDKGYYSEMDKVGLNAMYPDDCDKFIEMRYQEALARNKKRREQELKDRVQLINPGEKQYIEIQKKAREVIKPTQQPIVNMNIFKKLNQKISQEEALAIVKKNFGVAKDKECEAAFNSIDNGWRVVCNKQNYWIGSPGKYGTFYEFNYNFFFVSSDGKFWTSKGDYSKWQRDEGKDVRTFGKPMWGMQ